jgi:hypothetical protein
MHQAAGYLDRELPGSLSYGGIAEDGQRWLAVGASCAYAQSRMMLYPLVPRVV